MTAEEWRPIPGFEGYLVSNHGRVLSRRQGTPRLLSAPPGHKGYRTVGLMRSGRAESIRVHQLVAAAFIGPRPDGLQVRHLNGDNQNNHVANLAYGTPSENNLDQVAHGTHAFSRRTHCKNGHHYAPDSTVLGSRGERRCLLCSRAKDARKRALRRLVA